MKSRRTPQPTPTWCLICFSKRFEVVLHSTSRRTRFSKVGVVPSPKSRRACFFHGGRPALLKLSQNSIVQSSDTLTPTSQPITPPLFKGQLEALSQSQPSLSNISKCCSNETSYASPNKASNGLHMNTFCSGGSSKHRAEHPTNSSPVAGAQAS